MFNNDGKPVSVLVIEDTKIEGKEVPAGTVLRDCDAQLAMELASGGKVRPATEEALAELKRNKAAAAKAAEAREAEDAARTAASNKVTAELVASAVTTALKAAGVGAK